MTLVNSVFSMVVLAIALVLLYEMVTWLCEIVAALYYFGIKVPRFQSSLKEGQQALLLTSDVPVMIINLGDTHAWISVPTPPNKPPCERSVRHTDLFPLYGTKFKQIVADRVQCLTNTNAKKSAQ